MGICMEHSLEMLVGLLGILKAGGAYLPLDPSYPKERLAFMLEDARVPVLLTQERLVEGLPNHGAQVVCLDADWAAIAEARADNPDSGVGPDNLAYVIYTSGRGASPRQGTLRSAGTPARCRRHQPARRETASPRQRQRSGSARHDPWCSSRMSPAASGTVRRRQTEVARRSH